MSKDLIIRSSGAEFSTDNVGLHLKNIYNDFELDKDSTTEDFSVVQKEGSREVKRTIKYYNLDAVISVGYRVNSDRAIQFRVKQDQFYKSDFDKLMEESENYHSES